MKRDNFIQTKATRVLLKFLLSWLIGLGILIVLIALLALIHMKWSLEEHVIQFILVIFYSLASLICSYIFCKMSKMKGLICSGITAIVFMTIKIILLITSGGGGTRNIWIYPCVLCCSLIGGFFSANQKTKPQKQLVKITKK